MSRKMTGSTAEEKGFGFSFQALHGYGYGLNQKIMVGQIALTDDAQAKLRMALAECDLLTGITAGGSMSAEYIGSNQTSEALALYFATQQYAKIPVFTEHKLKSIEKTRTSSSASRQIWVSNLAIPYWNPEASRLVFQWISGIANKKVEARQGLQILIQELRPYSLDGTNSYHFLKAAWDLRMHYNVIHDRTIQFGIGKQSRWLDSSLTDQASFLSVRLAKDKRSTNVLLSRLGFPTTRQVVVRNAQEALAAQARMGCPIVLKPVSQDQGRGVSVDLSEEQEIRTAFDLALNYGADVVAEAYAWGNDYRLFTFQDRVVKCMLRAPLSVIGDGVSTVAELLKIKSSQPEHIREVSLSGKNPFLLDEEMIRVLKKSGLQPSSVPPCGDVVTLRKIANISAGGSQTLIDLSEIHPDNAKLAVEATRALRLDMGGVDLMIEDISKSWLDIGATIIEINAQPQIGISLAPETYAVILRDLISTSLLPEAVLVVFPSGATNLIPANPTIAAVMEKLKEPVLLASTHELWQDKTCVLKSDFPGIMMISAALQNPTADSLLFVLTTDELCRYGLPTQNLKQVYFVTNEQEKHQVDLTNLEARLIAGSKVPLQEINW